MATGTCRATAAARSSLRIFECTKPVIAAINGPGGRRRHHDDAADGHPARGRRRQDRVRLRAPRHRARGLLELVPAADRRHQPGDGVGGDRPRLRRRGGARRRARAQRPPGRTSCSPAAHALAREIADNTAPVSVALGAPADVADARRRRTRWRRTAPTRGRCSRAASRPTRARASRRSWRSARRPSRTACQAASRTSGSDPDVTPGVRRRRAPARGTPNDHGRPGDAREAAGDDREARARQRRDRARLDVAQPRAARDHERETDDIRPRSASGVTVWLMIERQTALTLSAAPATREQRRGEPQRRHQPGERDRQRPRRRPRRSRSGRAGARASSQPVVSAATVAPAETAA